jgi:putative intracellular protease/amidase
VPSVLVLLSRRGHAVQETLPVVDELKRLGIHVALGTESGGDVQFDPVCNAMALGEIAWSSSWRLLREAKRSGALQSVERPAGPVTDWPKRFDAIVIPGGHGQVFGSFVRSATVDEAIHAFAAAGKPVGLVCHAVAAASFQGLSGEAPLGSGREVTCWPRAMERALGALPFIGSYFVPFGTYAQDMVETVTARVRCSALPWRMPHAVVDNGLVTAWGPWSGPSFARALAGRLEVSQRG